MDAPWSGIDLGIAYVQLDVPVSCARSIAAFYHDVFNASVEIRDCNGSQQALLAGVGDCEPHLGQLFAL
ncbi:hypothetical protein [Paraburkholderia sp. BL6669N2]|uniref:hypothetical protein n=1 Tax=Paraburkholderia sp. BL6669N2 TaxID=1938807 RepID=UPI000E21F461|nr:hypothetical protein [Paraburkholderia sp. BL6669N2]